MTDAGQEPAAVVIDLPAGFAAERIGIDFTEEQITVALTDLGADVEKYDGGYKVTAPSWRQDLEIKEDLAEEIAGWSATTTSRRPCRWRLPGAA